MGNHTSSVQRGINLGVALFIVSEALFFLAIFWAFFHDLILKMGMCDLWSVKVNSVLLITIGLCCLINLCFYIILMHIVADIVKLNNLVLHLWLIKYKLFKELFNNNKNSLILSRRSTGSVQPLLSPFNPVCNRLLLNRNHGFILAGLSLKNFSSSTRYLSSSREPNIPLEFWEWLCGLTDGEANFYIRRRSGDTPVYSFKYSFGVHVDDKDMLIFIQKTLGIGKVSTYGSVSKYEVYDLKGTAKIIDIFTKYPFLNSTKLLNFLDYKKAFELYRSSKKISKEVDQEIANLKNGMNKQRTNIQMPESYKPIITPNWLLGFIEGEGSFSVVRGYGLTFSINQSSKDNALMVAIKNYLNNIPGAVEYMRSEKDSVVYLGTFMGTANNEITRISISQIGYIRSVLIPFFEGLVFRSKKYLDFQDWVNILKLRDRCHQYEEKGNKIMSLIVSQMNNKRLSTKGTSRVDRVSLQTSINDLLSGPSNSEIREGKIWIKSLNRFRPRGGLIKPMAVQLQDQNGNIIKTFGTQADCAKSLGVTRTTVARWLQDGKPVLFENKIVYIAKVEVLEKEGL